MVFLFHQLCSFHTAFYFQRSYALFLYISSFRQVHSIKSVAPFLHFTGAYLFVLSFCPLHQSVILLSRPFFLHIFCQIFSSQRFCNNHTNKSIILIATCTMIYSSFMMSTQRNISSFRPLLNDTQINAVIIINDLLLNT